MRNTVRSLVAGSLLVLTGCYDNFRESYEGDNVSVTKGNTRDSNYFNDDTSLVIYAKGPNGGYVIATDSESDGRFDKIDLINLPKGHELEKLASIEKVGEIFNQVTRESEKGNSGEE